MKTEAIVLSILTCAGAALAQPTSTDLGTLTPATPVSVTPSIAPTEIVWYRFTTTTATDALNFVDIDTEGSTLTPSNDTEIGLFSSTGALINSDDDSGSGLLSQLTYGGTCGPRPAVGSGAPYNGRNGNLPAGTYYLSFSGYNSTFAAGWTVTSTSNNVGQGQVTIRAGTATPATGGPGIFLEPCGTDAGELPATAAVAGGQTGSLNEIRGNFGSGDSDMYLIDICDEANFSATTVGGATVDTQLFLFTPAGLGVAMNDDSSGTLQSTLTSGFVTANGQYYLAISRYDRDPQDSTPADIWLDMPFNTERAPDGPGAANPIAGWTATATLAAPYTIFLTGACFVGGGAGCDNIDFNNDGVFPSTDDITDLLSVFGGGPCSTDPTPGCNDLDFNNDGVFPATDDIEAFLRVFSGGAC